MSNSLPPPLIIFASRASQGSFLSALLGGHPDLFGAPHLNVLAFENGWQHQEYCKVPRDSGSHGLLRALGHLLTGEQTVQSVQAARRWLAVRADETAQEIYSEIRAMIAPARLVDYSPLYALNKETMRRVVEVLPDAKVIHLTANPIRQGKLISRAVWQTTNASLGYWRDRGLDHPSLDSYEVGDHLIDWSVTPPVFDPQFSWHRTQKAASALLEELPPERGLRLSSERLVADTSAVLQELLPFLGCDGDAKIIERMVGNTDTTFTASGPFDASMGVDYDMIGRTVADLANTPVEDEPIVPQEPLSWRGDDDVLQPELVELAAGLGYRISQ